MRPGFGDHGFAFGADPWGLRDGFAAGAWRSPWSYSPEAQIGLWVTPPMAMAALTAAAMLAASAFALGVATGAVMAASGER